MKKLVSLVLAVAMILSLTTFATAAETESSWAAKALETVYNLDIMRGDQNGDMHLTEYLTREEMFSLMYRLSEAVGIMDTAAQNYWNMFGQAAGSYVGDISNVSFWAVPYAAYNWVNRIFTGDDKGNLNPKGNLSYYDCATLMLRALGFQNTLLLADGQWRLNVLRYGMEVGLFNYMSVTDLGAPITRMNIAVMVYNALQAETVICTTSTAGVTTYEFTGDTLIEDNFGFYDVDDIVSGGLVTAYDDEYKEICLNDNDDWVDASDIGVTNADLPELYGEYITWVAKPEDGKVLRAAEIKDLGWTTFSYKGSEDVTIGSKGYKADGKTEVAFDDAACAYVKVTTGGTTYVVPKIEMLESWNDVLYSYYDGWDVIDAVSSTWYSFETNTFRYADLGNGAGYVFFDNRDLWVIEYDKDSSSYDANTKTLTVNGWSALAAGNLVSGLADGDIVVVDYGYLYYDQIEVIYSVTKIEPTQVNGGLLTASYSGGSYDSVKLNGAAIGVSNGYDADDLAGLYALPTADDDGETLGYVYVLDGYIVEYSYGTYEEADTPATPTDDYFVYVTKAPTFAFDGALLKVTFEGNCNGVNGSYTVTLPNAAMLGDTATTYTIVEASAAFAVGKLVKVDPASATVAVTGQKVDVVTDTAVNTGYVYRWINLAYNNIDKTVAVTGMFGDPAALGTGTINLGDTAKVFYRDALVADNADASAIADNTIAKIIDGTNDDFTLAEICKTLYYTYNNGTKVVSVFMANAAFKADKRALWDNGVVTAPAGTSYMLLAGAPSLTVQGNGDITATLTGYIDGQLTTYALKVKAGTVDVTTLAGVLQDSKVVELVQTLSTGYTVCTQETGEDYSKGYIVRYVNETFDNLNKHIILKADGIVDTIDIEIGVANQVIVGSYAEERYETLESERVLYNAAKDPDLALKDIAKTAYVKYTANGKTYVVFTANSYDAAKRTAFETWVANN